MKLRLLPILALLPLLMAASKVDVATLEKMVQEDPKNAKAWNELGAQYGRMSRWKESISALRKAVALQKDYATAWYNLGFAHENAGDLAKAIEGYQQAVNIQDEFPEAWLSLGVVYQKQGKLDEARKLLPKLESQNPKAAKELQRLIEMTVTSAPKTK